MDSTIKSILTMAALTPIDALISILEQKSKEYKDNPNEETFMALKTICFILATHPGKDNNNPLETITKLNKAFEEFENSEKLKNIFN